MYVNKKIINLSKKALDKLKDSLKKQNYDMNNGYDMFMTILGALCEKDCMQNVLLRKMLNSLCYLIFLIRGRY